MGEHNCTNWFLNYREVARHVWNAGFVPYGELLCVPAERSYVTAMARLFEGMVLRPLGFADHLPDDYKLGSAVEFFVRPSAATNSANLLVHANARFEPGRAWGYPELRIRGEDRSLLRFVSFFDWQQFGTRHLRLLEVVIDELDVRPELVGRPALVDLDECAIWVRLPEDHYPARPGDGPTTRTDSEPVPLSPYGVW